MQLRYFQDLDAIYLLFIRVSIPIVREYPFVTWSSVVVSRAEVMINMHSGGAFVFNGRGEIHGFVKDGLRKHLPRMFSFINNHDPHLVNSCPAL